MKSNFTQNNNRRISDRLVQSISDYGIAIITVVLIVIFQISNSSFLSLLNIKNILEQDIPLAIVSVGITFTIISGNFDLSAGGLVSLCCMIIGVVFKSTNNIWLAFFCGILSGLFVGIIQGIIIAKAGIASVIVTLATMIWARGLAYGLAQGTSIMIFSPVVDFINSGFVFGFSISIIIAIIIYIIGHQILNKTKLGRYTFALGGNEMSTKQAGVNTKKYKIFIFAFSGLLVGIASVLSLSRISTAQPNVASTLEMDAIVAAIIGGNLLSGGKGSIFKTIIGVMFINILSSGLSTLGLTDDFNKLIKGCAILFALIIQVVNSRIISKRNSIKLNI